MAATGGALDIQKNKREVIRASLGELDNRPLASLWVFVKGKDGELKPSTKGISFSRSLLPQIEQAVRALREQDESLGRVA